MDWFSLVKFNLIRKKLTKSGQINIAETVVSATIILVLAVSVAQLGSTVSLNQQTSSYDVVKQKAQNALDLGFSLGYVRELAYSPNPSGSQAQSNLLALITENLPSSAQFSLFQERVNRTSDPYNNRILLGVNPIPSGNLNIFSVSVFVSGYFDGTTIYSTPYIVTLIVALGE